MNKITSLEDTKSAEFEALPIRDRIVLLDQFLDEVEKSQFHFIRLQKAYEESVQTDRAAGAAGRVANLQEILDEGEELLDHLRAGRSVKSEPIKKAKSSKASKAAPVDGSAIEADPEILRIINSQEVKHD